MPITPQEAAHIESHTEVLRKNLIDSVNHGRHYLFFTNAGAAVALMTFMGNSHSVRSSGAVWLSLGLFALGIIVTGIFNIRDYCAHDNEFREWFRDMDQLARGAIKSDVLYKNLSDRIERSRRHLEGLAIAAFLCFVIGVVISIWHFLCAVY